METVGIQVVISGGSKPLKELKNENGICKYIKRYCHSKNGPLFIADLPRNLFISFTNMHF